MKLLMLSVAMACQAFAFAFQAVCQEAAPDRPRLIHTESPRLHFTIPFPEGEGRVELAASSAQRVSAKTESILYLRGNVAVRTIICVRGVCDGGSMVLHADAVDYNETTGEIEAHGEVHIDPYRTFPDHSSLE
jgi:lipopolysaccharide assembly outer membrane protein LptD (OstA)